MAALVTIAAADMCYVGLQDLVLEWLSIGMLYLPKSFRFVFRRAFRSSFRLLCFHYGRRQWQRHRCASGAASTASSIAVDNRVQGPVHVHDDAVAIKPCDPVIVPRSKIISDQLQLRVLDVDSLIWHRVLEVHVNIVTVLLCIGSPILWCHCSQNQRMIFRVSANGDDRNSKTWNSKIRLTLWEAGEATLLLLVQLVPQKLDFFDNLVRSRGPIPSSVRWHFKRIPQCEDINEGELE
mmetsp:Transcript_98749/g.175791  ORF Transcript_98749/g.175791 Transcript_98749/m.175791 type:complete len:237 (-) Transcript_98749:458-1168(-)